uniref:GAF domain-containing protein n=1 Tax=Zooxanthella nutricula TaxID=1333877 RepID=A0A7S2Q1P4_9DINO
MNVPVESVEQEQKALDQYVKGKCVAEAVQDVVQSLITAKPINPKQWLLEHLEGELSNESQDLSESDLHRLFATTRKITSEIVPQEAIESVIRETIVLLNCDRVSLFVVDRKMSKLRLYASNLATPIMVSPGQGIVGSVFSHKHTVNIGNCYLDQRFDRSFDDKTGYTTRSLIAMPILDFENNCIGVIQAINKLPFDQTQKVEKAGTDPIGTCAVPFEKNDERMLMHLTQHVGIAMRNAELYREAIATSERATGFLNTIQSISQDLGTQSMLLTITMHANKIVSSERATVFLVDEPNQQLWSVSTDTGQEIRIPMRAGIAGQCFVEANVINIPDAYADKRFNQEVDKKTGFKTQSILAIPMLEDDAAREEFEKAAQKRKSLATLADKKVTEQGNKVIGVIQMINKVSFDGQLEIFDEGDIEVMELFAKFVGPKLAMSSFLATRHSEPSDRKEAELALGRQPQQTDDMVRMHKRSSRGQGTGGMIVLGEDGEEDDEDGFGVVD